MEGQPGKPQDGLLRRLFKKDTPEDKAAMSIAPADYQADRGTDLHDIRLGDKTPLYHALLDNPRTPNLTAFEGEQAKSRLDAIIGQNPKLVQSCQGLSLAEARQRLLEAEQGKQREAA